MKKSPTPLGLNGIYLGKEHNSYIHGFPESKSKANGNINNSPTTFLPIHNSSPPPMRPPLSPPAPEAKLPVKQNIIPVAIQQNERNTAPPLPPTSTSPPPPLPQPQTISASSIKKEGIASSPAPVSPPSAIVPQTESQSAPSPSPPPPSAVQKSEPQPQSRPISTSPSVPKSNSPTPHSPQPSRSQKNVNSKERKNHPPPPKMKSPKLEKESNGGYVGKTLRSQKMEMRIRAAMENEDESTPSNTSSESSHSQTESSSSSQQQSRGKIYEPDLNTYGISNGSLANRTKRILEKQAKIEGVNKKGNQDDKSSSLQDDSKDDKATASSGVDSQSVPSVDSPTEHKTTSNSNTNPPLSPSPPNSAATSEDSKLPPNSFPYPFPYPPSPYGYPPYSNAPPPYGYPPAFPQGYPPYPGYYPHFPGGAQSSGSLFPSLNLEPPGSQPLNFDLHTLMLAKQLMGLSDQLKGLNSTAFDPTEYLRSMSLFQQLAAGLMEHTNSVQQHQYANEAHENERRTQQEDMTRALQEQIRHLQSQLQQHLMKMELAKGESEEKEARMRELRQKEYEERERLRVETEREDRLQKEQAELAEREERRRREALDISERQERERMRALREQEEREEKEKLRLIREKAELGEREEREKLREIREREEREERERLREIRERVEREEREEKERLREIRERIEREEKEEMERLREIREREEKEALDRRLQREAAEAAEAAEKLRLQSQNNIIQSHPSPPKKVRPSRDDELQLTPEMQEMADAHRRRTGKELPRVLYRLVPHRTKFRRANELFESNIHADQIARDDESQHSVTSESIRDFMLKEESQYRRLSTTRPSPKHPPLQHQFSLPPPTIEPIVVARQTRFSCDNPLYQSKDDFWIDPNTPLIPETPPIVPPSSSPKSSSPKGTILDALDTFKNYLRKKSIFSDNSTLTSEDSERPSAYIPQPLPPINIDKIASTQRRPKRGSKDDLEIERITTLMSISAAHLRQVNLTPGHHRHHLGKKSE